MCCFFKVLLAVLFSCLSKSVFFSFQFPLYVYDFIQGTFFLIPFSMSEFAGFKNIYYMSIHKKGSRPNTVSVESMNNALDSEFVDAVAMPRKLLIHYSKTETISKLLRFFSQCKKIIGSNLGHTTLSLFTVVKVFVFPRPSRRNLESISK